MSTSPPGDDPAAVQETIAAKFGWPEPLGLPELFHPLEHREARARASRGDTIAFLGWAGWMVALGTMVFASPLVATQGFGALGLMAVAAVGLTLLARLGSGFQRRARVQLQEVDPTGLLGHRSKDERWRSTVDLALSCLRDCADNEALSEDIKVLVRRHHLLDRRRARLASALAKDEQAASTGAPTQGDAEALQVAMDAVDAGIDQLVATLRRVHQRLALRDPLLLEEAQAELHDLSARLSAEREVAELGQDLEGLDPKGRASMAAVHTP